MEDSIPSYPHVPDDIVFDILYRLPVKTLVRFSSACKLWRKLVTTDRLFILSQLQNNVNNISGYDNLLGGHSRENSSRHENLDLQAEIFTKKLKHASENSPAYRLIFGEGKFKIAGCCDGMICFVKDSRNWDSRFMVYLCNPALHQYRALPPGNYEIESCPTNTIVSFFFDPVTDDYKVVKIIDRRNFFVVDMYSLSTNSWKSLSWRILTPCPQVLFRRPVVHNGFPYWFGHCRKDSTHVLNVLDTVQEEIRAIWFPDLFRYPHLELFQGSLSIFGTNTIYQNELWVMKEDKTGLISWTKHLVIPEISIIHPLSNRTTGVTASEKHLISSWWLSGILFLYDPKDKKMEDRFEVPRDVSHHEYVVADYVQSLVSVIPPPAPADEKVPQGQNENKARRSYSSRPSFLSRMLNCFVGKKNASMS